MPKRIVKEEELYDENYIEEPYEWRPINDCSKEVRQELTMNFETMKEADTWLVTANHYLGRAPIEVLKEKGGEDKVMAALEALASGAYI